MESQPQNPEFRNNPETFTHKNISFLLMQDPNFKDKWSELTDKN